MSGWRQTQRGILVSDCSRHLIAPQSDPHPTEEREALEAQQPPANPKDFTPPVVTNPRGPLSSFEPRNSLEHAAHGGKGPALPDLQGGTHIPEKELVPRHHESQHTALRPSDPNDPTVSRPSGYDEERDERRGRNLTLLASHRPWTELETRGPLEMTWLSRLPATVVIH